MPSVIRVGVTGLARAGKTALLTALAADLLAGGNALPAFTTRLGGRSLRVRVAAAGASSVPQFDYAAHVAALAADPAHWPSRTDAVSLLALDLEIGRIGLAAALPPQKLRLELLDYPGEWLLDLPLLSLSYADWSRQTLARLAKIPAASGFNVFAQGIPATAPADESVARGGAALYRDLLRTLRDDHGLSLLQPGRMLMPAPGPEPPWTLFFPWTGSGPLGGLLRARYDAYVKAVREDLSAPSFGRIDRLVVLADILAALHAGPAAFADAAEALSTVAAALRWKRAPGFVPAWLGGLLPFWSGISRVAFAASKADHVAERQRGNLAALMASLTRMPQTASQTALALAAIRCTEDFVWTLEGRPVSAVRGRVAGQGLVGCYPGEVPDRPPTADFWAHPFLAIPEFEPKRLPLGGRLGMPHIQLDTLLLFLLEDVL